MTELEIIHEIGEITKQLTGPVSLTSKQGREMLKDLRKHQVELNRIQGLTWDYENWATDVKCVSEKSLKDARVGLIEKLKGMHGIEIEASDTGVATVKVYTDWKVYIYEIHAYYSNEIVGYEKKPGFFGDPDDPDTWIDEAIFKQVYVACLMKRSGFPDWGWRFE